MPDTNSINPEVIGYDLQIYIPHIIAELDELKKDKLLQKSSHYLITHVLGEWTNMMLQSGRSIIRFPETESEQ